MGKRVTINSKQWPDNGGAHILSQRAHLSLHNIVLPPLKSKRGFGVDPTNARADLAASTPAPMSGRRILGAWRFSAISPSIEVVASMQPVGRANSNQSIWQFHAMAT